MNLLNIVYVRFLALSPPTEVFSMLRRRLNEVLMGTTSLMFPFKSLRVHLSLLLLLLWWCSRVHDFSRHSVHTIFADLGVFLSLFFPRGSFLGAFVFQSHGVSGSVGYPIFSLRSLLVWDLPPLHPGEAPGRGAGAAAPEVRQRHHEQRRSEFKRRNRGAV